LPQACFDRLTFGSGQDAPFAGAKGLTADQSLYPVAAQFQVYAVVNDAEVFAV
jgi:hypothetical protein